MKILVFSACSSIKSMKFPNQPNCKEIISKEMRERFLHMSPEKKTARELFRGAINININSAVSQLKEFFDVKHFIVTAGFGIVEENELVPPYDCSFSEMSKTQIKERANMLKIPQEFHEIIEQNSPDVIYLALGQNHLEAVSNWDDNLPCKTIAFSNSNNPMVISLPLEHITTPEVVRVTGLPVNAVAGYKDDLLLLTTRYLKNFKDQEKALRDLISDPKELLYVINMIRTNY